NALHAGATRPVGLAETASHTYDHAKKRSPRYREFRYDLFLPSAQLPHLPVEHPARMYTRYRLDRGAQHEYVPHPRRPLKAVGAEIAFHDEAPLQFSTASFSPLAGDRSRIIS